MNHKCIFIIIIIIIIIVIIIIIIITIIIIINSFKLTTSYLLFLNVVFHVVNLPIVTT